MEQKPKLITQILALLNDQEEGSFESDSILKLVYTILQKQLASQHTPDALRSEKTENIPSHHAMKLEYLKELIQKVDGPEPIKSNAPPVFRRSDGS